MNDIIKIVYKFLDKKSIGSYRQCNKYLMILIGAIYFNNILVDINKIYDPSFCQLVKKYELSLNLKNVKNILELHNAQKHYEIKYVSFNNLFNEDIKRDSLPQSLQTLKFGRCFNQELKPGDLPVSLKVLKFGSNFNKEIKKNIIPPTLQTLEFGLHFSNKIHFDGLPLKTLKKLIVNKDYWLYTCYGDSVFYNIDAKNIKIKKSFIKYGDNEDHRVFLLF